MDTKLPSNEELGKVVAEIDAILEKKIAENLPLKKVDPEFSFKELLHESPRGCILSSTAFLDGILENRIRERLTKLSGASKKDLDFLLTNRPVPPLGSFGIRIRIARVLGIISDEVRRALAAVQDLRNSKAHSWKSARITDSDVRSITKHFGATERKLAKDIAYFMECFIRKQMGPLDGIAARPSREQIEFIFAVTHLVSEISPVDQQPD